MADDQNLVVRQIDGQAVSGTVTSNGDFFSADGSILQLPDGFVEHGKIEPDGTFLAETTVDGKVVWGNFGSDGSFLSQDGTVYVPAGGTPETGITDPVTGDFLPDGVVRQIDGQTVYGTVSSNGDFLSADGSILQLPDGFVEHGKLESDGTFLAEDTVNGKEVWGSYGSDGSFLSQDGTIYVPAGGTPETGITDPATGDFLPNGVVRQIDGQTVYGIVDSSGDFISADGSILQLPNGFVEHGKLESDGTFLAELIVDGQVLWGSYGSDGSFLSQDGTIYVPPGGKPETGITTPDGNFLPGGTTYKLSNGTVLYGYTDDGSFYTYNGTTIVLNNGTMVTGSLNQTTGIFTGSNGQDYFVGQDGIVPVKPQPDGSYVEPNGDVIMTAQSWSVDLGQFSDAMQTVKTNTASIADAYNSIRGQYTAIEAAWSSPAGTTFADTTSTIDSAMNQLNSVLESISAAMQQSYSNYLKTEQADIHNATGS